MSYKSHNESFTSSDLPQGAFQFVDELGQSSLILLFVVLENAELEPRIDLLQVRSPVLIADEVDLDLVAKMIQENHAKRCANVQVTAEFERLRFSLRIRKSREEDSLKMTL